MAIITALIVQCASKTSRSRKEQVVIARRQIRKAVMAIGIRHRRAN